MAYAFGVGAVAMRNECVSFKVAASAAASIADQRAVLARLGCRRLDTVSVRLGAVETKRYRDVDRVRRIKFADSPVGVERDLHCVSSSYACFSHNRGEVDLLN